MGSISVKVNLRQLKHVVEKRKGATGEIECLVIPIDANNLFVGEKGVYLDMTAFEFKNNVGDSKNTHLMKQSLPKELYESMSEEEKRELPIIGNAIQWGRQEPAPIPADIQGEEEQDDLPF